MIRDRLITDDAAATSVPSSLAPSGPSTGAGPAVTPITTPAPGTPGVETSQPSRSRPKRDNPDSQEGTAEEDGAPAHIYRKTGHGSEYTVSQPL